MSGPHQALVTPLPHELVDWPRRLAREEALITRVLTEAPSRRVVDLGCGTGEHARFIAKMGCEVVAIDASEAALDRAQDDPIPSGVEYLLGDIGAVERSVNGHFGAAICLGNTLPHLLSPESLSRLLVGLKRRLLPGASVLLQVLNYDRVFDAGVRTLPLEILPSAAGDLVIVGLLEPRADGIVLHTTCALRHRAAGDPVIEVVETRRTQLRGWRRIELEAMLEVARLPVRDVFGDMGSAPFEPDLSPELVLVAG